MHIVKNTPSGAGRIIGIILLVLLVIVAGAWIYWTTNKKKIIGNKIEQMVEKKSGGMYAINYDDMAADEVGGNLSLKNVRVGYDSAKYAALANQKDVPAMLFKINIPELSITGVNTAKAISGKEIVGKKLRILNPDIQLIYTYSGKNAKKNIPGNEIYRQLLGNLDLIKIDTVEIINARIVTKDIRTGKVKMVFSNSNILLNGVAVDSVSNLDTTRYLFARSMNFNIGKISWPAKTGYYDYDMSNITLNSAEKNIRIGSVNINPQFGEAAFVNRAPYQTDRLDITLSNILLSNVDFTQLEKEVVIADELEAGSASIKAYRDLRRPRDNKNRIGSYPHQKLMEVPIPFVIRKATFRNTFIEYKETSDVSGQTGAVQFNNCIINISNLTNDRAALRKNNDCRIEVNASLMNMTTLKANLVLSLGDKDGRFSVEGTTGGGDALKLNKIAEPMGMAKIRSGSIKSLHFKLNGNNTQANGQVTILYNDLKLDLLELDDDKKSGIDKKDLTSFVANLFIKDDNPKNGDAIRTATVQHPRDVTRSFYNLVWKSILEGVNHSIGNKKKMKRG